VAPGEKGLSFRRAADALLRRRTGRLREDLSSPARAATRFNLSGVGRSRRLRDDSWIAAARLRDALLREGGPGLERRRDLDEPGAPASRPPQTPVKRTRSPTPT
jgi:hypothetical protein